MLIFEISNLKKYYSDRLILDIETFKLYSEDRIGIVGLNGVGKTTLMDLISGKINPDEGTIKLYGNYSYITQFGFDESVDTNKVMIRKFKTLNSYEAFMSGGEKMRLKLAQSFSDTKDFIIADEPTSNLDIKGIQELEQNLKIYKGALLVISHDRSLLDTVCNKIMEIENGKIKIYNGSYDQYKLQKEQELSRQNFEHEQYIKEYGRLQNAITEKRQKTASIKKAPSRMGNSEARLHKMGDQNARKKLSKSIKAIESRISKLEVKEKPKEISKVKIDISQKNIYSKIVIQGKHINKHFDKRCIFKDAEFNIYNGWKTALIGDNGTGKTTLVKMILSGECGIKINPNAKIGYFSQDLNILDENLSIIENMKISSLHDETFIRIVLGRLLFKNDDIYKKVSILSGGEKVKAAFAKMLLQDINVLILDEPTNYLDIYSIEAFESALKEYSGTLLLVSHDRKFVDAIADHLLIVEENKLIRFTGTYSDYIQKRSSVKTSTDSIEDQTMILKNRLTEVLSRLSMPSKNDDIATLDAEYKSLLKQLNELNKLH